MELWVGCVAGALDENDYLARLRAAGFENPTIETTRKYDAFPNVPGEIYSGFIRATKPA